jgi:uncharacterized protein
MERTKSNSQIETLTSKQLQVLTSMVVARMGYATQLGLQYNGDRDIYKALGYSATMTYEDYYNYYLRQDIAKAVIDRPVKATWQGQLELIESSDPEKTPFEEAWNKLNRELKLRSLLSRVDRLTGIGHYGVLLLGLDDVSTTMGFMKPVSAGNRILKYVKPFGEKSAKIDKYESDPSNPRYGMPFTYNIQVQDVASGSAMTVPVHYSRIIHITDDNLESDINGIPRLEAVYNRLMDLDKVVGGSAEMFWRGARPGFQGMVDKDFTMTAETKEDIMNQIEEYEKNLRRILINEGVDLKALAQQIADPSKNLDVILTCISAATQIPKRILSGSERGELASTQDSGEWKTYVQSRREDHAEPHIIFPFVDKLIEYGILPTPETQYTVDWLDLFSVSEKERVEIGVRRANAIREYTTNPSAQALMPPDAFFELCLGLSTQQINLVQKLIEKGISDEQKELMDELMGILTPPAPITKTSSTSKPVEANKSGIVRTRINK